MVVFEIFASSIIYHYKDRVSMETSADIAHRSFLHKDLKFASVFSYPVMQWRSVVLQA